MVQVSERCKTGVRKVELTCPVVCFASDGTKQYKCEHYGKILYFLCVLKRVSNTRRERDRGLKDEIAGNGAAVDRVTYPLHVMHQERSMGCAGKTP